MADSRISALSAIPAVAAGDLLYIIDVSDTSEDAGGSGFKVTADNFADAVSTLLGLGTAALAATGDFDAAGAAGTAQSYAIQRGNHTGTQVASTISDFSEAVDDRVGALLTQGSNITLTYNDAAGTLTIAVSGLASTDVSDFTEAVQDVMGAILTDGTTSDWTYTDGSNTLALEVKAASLTDAHISGSAAIALSKLATNPVARANHTGTQTASTISDFDTQVATTAVQKANGGKETVSTDTAVTGSKTIDLANGNVFNCTLTGNTTFTFSGSAASTACSFTLIARQDGTGSRTITWPASVDWAAGTAPTISTAASKVDVFTFITVDNGTTWLGFTGGIDLR